MPVIKVKPTSPGRRGLVKVVHPHLHKGGPLSSLTEQKSNTGGRNNNGRITTRHRGGGSRQHYRIIDFKRNKDGIPAKVERIEYDPDRNLLFINLEGWSVRKRSDLDDLKRVIEVACKEAGRRVHAIVNLDGFRVAEDLVDDHLALIEHLKQNQYMSRSRYTTSAFMRMKMQDKVGELERAPHIFSSEEKAHAAREAAALRRRLQHVERLD